jgi:1-carboxybiuret hydrolase subunit AtzH-like protein
VKAAFGRYEQALVANDVATLNELFRNDPCTIRCGAAENLYGYAEIAAFRGSRSPVGLARYSRASAPGKNGRQMQTSVRFPEGWRIVAAHVSMIDMPRSGSS